MLSSRPAETRFHIEAIERLGVHFSGEVLELVSAGAFGFVHRDVGAALEDVDVMAVLGEDGDADGGGNEELTAVDFDGMGKRAQETPRDADGILFIGEVRQDDGEFVAAHPAKRVIFAQTGFEPLADGAEEAVAGVVAEGVIDELEAVEVDEHEADIAMLAARDGNRLVKTVFEKGAVGQSGERIMAGLVGEARCSSSACIARIRHASRSRR